MNINKIKNSDKGLKAESLQTNYLKIQIEKNFSTGNINCIEDTSSMDNENDYSFNEDINSLSSYEVEYTNSVHSSPNNHERPSMEPPEIMFSFEDSSTASFENSNNGDNTYHNNKDEAGPSHHLKENILSEERKAFKIGTPDNNVIHYNNIDLNNRNNNNNNNNTINNNNKDNDNNSDNTSTDTLEYNSLTKKGHLIPKELKEVTSSYSTLLCNELTKTTESHHNENNSLGSTESLTGYNSSSSMSSLTGSLHKSPESSRNSSKISLQQTSEKITSSNNNLNALPLVMEGNNSQCNLDIANRSKEVQDNKGKEMKKSKNEENKKPRRLSFKKDILTDKELDGFHRWVLCFCIVNFDLEVGQALEYVYPPTNLTDEEKKNVSFSAFPDSNSSSHKGNSIFCFRMKSGPSTERLYHRQHHFSPVALMKKEDEQFNGKLKHPEKYQKDLKIDMDGYLYGYVFFRQQKDPTNKRGYFQKSFVLLSPHPFKGLFMKIVEKLGLLYFSSLKIGKTVDDKILIQKRQKIFKMSVAFINKWPNPPCILNDRYFFIRSNSVKQTPPNMVLSFPFFKSIYPIMFAPANHYPQFFNTNTNSQNMNSQDKSSNTIIHQEMPVCPGRIYEIFRHSIEDTWQVWEMMILGEPILVLGDTPRSCSETVYSFIELIKPVPYGGDFRPYFTIQDSDFKSIVKKEDKDDTLPNVIIGTTNPVFNKALSHWPNIVYVQRKPCNNSMINNDKIAQQPIGVGKPIKRESHSIVSSLLTSFLPSSNTVSNSNSLKNIATLLPNIGSTSSVNALASSPASSSLSNLEGPTNTNSNTQSNTTNTNDKSNTQNTNASSSNKSNTFGGFNWQSLLNGNSSNSSATANQVKRSSSHDITNLATEEMNTHSNKSNQNSKSRNSLLSSLAQKRSSSDLMNLKGRDESPSLNSSTSTLQEVTSLTPSGSTNNLAHEEPSKPQMPSSVQPTPPGKTNIECVERIVTKHKTYFQRDKSIIKKITEAALMGYSLDIINNMFRRHFVELSEKFLQPLDYYFDKEVIYNVRLMKFSDLRFSPQIENFNIEAFLKIINETAPVFPLKCKRSLIEFYRLFIKSPNFSLWFLLRVCNAFREWRRRYFYVMCEGDIRYWIKTGSTRFYTNLGAKSSTANLSQSSVTNTTTTTNHSNNAHSTSSSQQQKSKKSEELKVNTTSANKMSDHNIRVKSPELRARVPNTFDTSSMDRQRSKEINVKTPKLIEIIELLMRYRDELFHYEGLFVEKDVDLTSFSSSSEQLEDKKGSSSSSKGNSNNNINSSSSTTTTTTTTTNNLEVPSVDSNTNLTGFYQMRRTFSNSVEFTPNSSKSSLSSNGSSKKESSGSSSNKGKGGEEKEKGESTHSRKEGKERRRRASSTTSLKTHPDDTPTPPSKMTKKPMSTPTNGTTSKGKMRRNTGPPKPSTLAAEEEEATLNDLNDQETSKIYDREELIHRIFSHPEIEKFRKRKSRHRHILLPIPLSCPTPKSTRFYENLTSMDDLILPTKEQYQKLKKQYHVLLNTFSEDLRLAIEEQLRN